MTTKRLYYTDSYLTEVKTMATTRDGGSRVVLEQTVFYPTSGGQPHDAGTLNDIPVLDVVDEGGSVVHVLAEPMNATDIHARIDWHRRYDHMQQHTGQHLLSAVFEELFQIPTLSFHMGLQFSSIELGTKELSTHQIESVTQRATELARANPKVSILFEDAAVTKDLRKRSDREGIIRIIEIPDVDRSACGGTHVANLAEVLPLQFRDSEKVRGHVRITFVCGNRALVHAQQDFKALSSTAKALGVPIENVETQVATLQARLAEAEKHRQRLVNEAAARAGLELYARTVPDQDGTHSLLLKVPVIDDGSRQQANAYATQEKAILLLHSDSSVMLACSPDSGFHAGEVVKRVLARFGARGGGSAVLAQANLPNLTILQELAQELRLKLLIS
jgi:alanyl-tRNA synthetase